MLGFALIPFDGTLDFTKVLKHLKDSHYSGPITLELFHRYDYLNMGIEEFYQKGYQVRRKTRKNDERNIKKRI